MGTIASVANRTTNTTSGNPCLEIIAGTNIGYRLLELGVMQGATANLGGIGIGFSQAKGVTPTTPVTLLSEDQNNTNTLNTQTALAWATAPTVPFAFIGRTGLTPVAAATGNAFIWSFPRPLVVSKNKSFIMWNFISSTALDTWVVVDE